MAGPAAPQGASQTPTVTAQLAFDLEANDNFDLREDSVGTGVIATTRLSYGLFQQTTVDEVSLDVSGALRASDFPEVGTEARADDPRINLNYGREIDDNSIDVFLFFNRADLDFFDPLSDVDDDGQFDATRTEGTRQSFRFAANTTINDDGPVSLSAGVRFNSIQFSDLAEDDDEDDREEIGANASVGFDISPVLRLSVNGFFEREDDGDDDGDSIRFRQGASIGANARINPRTTAFARLGFTRAEADRDEDDDNEKFEDGFVGTLGFAIDEQRGQTRGSIGNDINENGRLTTISVGRTLELPNASLNADLGVTQNDDNDFFFTGGLDYAYSLRRATFAVGINQQIGTDSDGDDTVNTFGNISYAQGLTPVSSVQFILTGGLSRTADEDRTTDNERVNFTAQYNQQITRFWSANFGYRGRFFDDEDQDPATSNAVFVGLVRDFSAVK